MNISDFVIIGIIAVAVGFAIGKIIKDRKKGCSCGCGCSGCGTKCEKRE